MVTTKTTITFRIPDEYILAQRFATHHPDWTEHCGSGYVGYTRQEMYAVDLEKEGEERC